MPAYPPSLPYQPGLDRPDSRVFAGATVTDRVEPPKPEKAIRYCQSFLAVPRRTNVPPIGHYELSMMVSFVD